MLLIGGKFSPAELSRVGSSAVESVSCNLQDASRTKCDSIFASVGTSGYVSLIEFKRAVLALVSIVLSVCVVCDWFGCRA